MQIRVLDLKLLNIGTGVTVAKPSILSQETGPYLIYSHTYIRIYLHLSGFPSIRPYIFLSQEPLQKLLRPFGLNHNPRSLNPKS